MGIECRDDLGDFDEIALLLILFSIFFKEKGLRIVDSMRKEILRPVTLVQFCFLRCV